MHFSKYRFIVALVFFATFVAPAPLWFRENDNEADDHLARREPKNGYMAAAVGVAKQLRHLKPRPDTGTVFWSGIRPGKEPGSIIRADDDAECFAKNTGKQTIYDGLDDINVRIPGPDENPHCVRLWEFAGKTWARHTTGDAHVILGENVNKNGIWKKVEEKELMKNDNVTKLTAIYPHTGDWKLLKNQESSKAGNTKSGGN